METDKWGVITNQSGQKKKSRSRSSDETKSEDTGAKPKRQKQKQTQKLKTPEIQLPVPDVDEELTEAKVRGMLADLRERGPGNKYYKPFYLTPLLFAYLVHKYENSCIFKIIGKESTRIMKYDYHPENKGYRISFHTSFPRILRDCVKRGSKLIFIPLSISTVTDAHANLLIYRPDVKTVERFDPHGSQTEMFGDEGENEEMNRDLNDDLKELFETKLRPALGSYTPKYVPPNLLCPVRKGGFQAVENLLPSKNEAGYCSMWSLFFMETVMLNPSVPSKRLIEACMRVGNSDPTYFRNVIRGYTQKIVGEMKHLLRDYVKCDFTALNCPDHFNKHLLDDARPLYKDMRRRAAARQTLRRNLGNSSPRRTSVSSSSEPKVPYRARLMTELRKITDPKLFRMYKLLLEQGTPTNKQQNARELVHEVHELMTNHEYGLTVDRLDKALSAPIDLKKGKDDSLLRAHAYYLHFERFPHAYIDLDELDLKNMDEAREDVRKNYPTQKKFCNQILSEMDETSTTPMTDAEQGRLRAKVQKLLDEDVWELRYLLDHKRKFDLGDDDSARKYVNHSFDQADKDALVADLVRLNMPLDDAADWLRVAEK